MKKYIRFLCCGAFACGVLSACTMFEKNASSNEMEMLTKDVLKKGEGVDIEIKPVPVEKAK